MDFWITLIIVTVTYIGIAVGRWPGLRANRTTITLMGAGLLIATRQVAFSALGDFLDLDTLILLFSMMILNANLQMAGFFQLAGRGLLKTARSPRILLAVEIALAGLLSALFLNDTICLMFTPLVVQITQGARRNPLPYLIALATASNIGSAATLTGNPQNMIIGTASGISYLDFALPLLPVAVMGLVVVWGVVIWFYPGEFRREALGDLTEQPLELNRPLLIKSLVVTGGLLTAFLLGAPVAEASFLAACALLFTRRVSPEHVFYEINWGLLAFFAAMFVVTGSLEANGVAGELFRLAGLSPDTGIWQFSLTTLVLSNLVSNVPAVLLLKPVVMQLHSPTAGWLTLAVASTLAGNLTLLGSVANLIVAEIAGSARIHMGFWEYTRVGLLVTIVTLAAGIMWLQFAVW
ncbi:anion transporter [Levilinea saccharolytica]|uniref:Citrate transporter n=1 Tax=Levilinea saccharolytica TaxID=229921 RepID=A0A0P6XXF1_9CHLR|nr:anion transporter [Levilinea saccharolytica]KPL84880.1 citrate transporter [Levilinea saccharolytica]GAP18404.1 transporter, YbiR family [Levilinea saccharolytica]